MAQTTKEQILGTPQENAQNTATEVVSPTPPPTMPNGGTQATGNNGTEAVVNNGANIAPQATGTPSTTTSQTQNPAPAVAPTSSGNTNDIQQQQTGGFNPNNLGAITQYIKSITPFTPKSPEEIEKEKRKMRRDKMFAAIGDGISAMSNLYFTTQNAPNMFNPATSMSKKVQDRYDKLEREYNENMRTYLPMYMQAMKMDDDNRKDERNWNRLLERDKKDDAKFEWQKTFETDKFNWQKDSWQKEFNQKVEQFNKTFNENQRQFDKRLEHDDRALDETIRHNKKGEHLQAESNAESKRHNKASEANQRKSIEAQHRGDNLVFNMGDAGEISINKNRLNTANIATVFNATPTDGRPSGGRDPMTGKISLPSDNEMLAWIGMNADDPRVQRAWTKIGGKTSGPRAY